jgi:hypothetical protein
MKFLKKQSSLADSGITGTVTKLNEKKIDSYFDGQQYGKVAKDIIFVFLNALVLVHKNLNYKQEALKWTKD